MIQKNKTKKTIATGVIHKVPDDLKETLVAKPAVLEKWNSLSPLARNEWICWVTIVKKNEIRKEHLIRLCEDLQMGKKRPCCWPGCPHRRDSAKKWFK
ncbi:MAG TPA: YdeI/OmpD-associated family protein [Patescibacteria group bacterium]|nr:YdeI/OmpD-associated family protein [Patescibacteria group bacterium]